MLPATVILVRYLIRIGTRETEKGEGEMEFRARQGHHATATVIMALSMILAVLATNKSESPRDEDETDVEDASTIIPTITPTYQPAFIVNRNVRDYGAKGDGITDDTLAFVKALTEGKATILAPGAWNSSQYNCQTTRPSYVYVPAGTYKITATLPLTFYTQLVGEHDNRPRLVAHGSKYSVLDAGIDEGPGHGWFGNVNQNNFYHQLRNMVIDLQHCSSCVGLHWQVSQATNVVNVEFVLGPSSSSNTGLVMENGSGGYFGDMIFIGGLTAMAIGNQQFTMRNVTISGSTTGIHMFWNWIWALHDVRIENVETAILLDGGVSSISLVDVSIANAAVGITTVSGTSQVTLDGGVFSNVTKPLLVNGTLVGDVTTTSLSYAFERRVDGTFFKGRAVFPARPALLLDPSSRKYFGKTRPNYKSFMVASLVNDTDVTSSLQSALNAAASAGSALLVPYGVYWITRTVTIPVGTRLFGQAWTRFAPQGAYFTNAASPKPVFRVGNPGDVGVAQIADIMFTTRGPAPGAIMMEWNVRGASPGDSGVWDVHHRIGGAAGSLVDKNDCPKNATLATSPQCVGVHTLVHIKPNASVYIENMWGWVGDHNIDSGHDVNCFSARGLVVETAEPVWLYGTAMEHSYLYQYNLAQSVSNVLLSILQTETPYFQPQFQLTSSASTDPLFYADQYHAFSIAASYSPSNVVLYGTGMYSFFHDWATNCGSSAQQVACQTHMSLWILGGSGGGGVRLHNFNTHGGEFVLSFNGTNVPAATTGNGFCSTVSTW